MALRKLKGFDTILKAHSGLFNERADRLLYLARMVRVDERQFAGLHRLLGEVGRILDAAELPEMYVGNNPFTNAMTIGMDKPIIVLNSALLDLLDEEEMRFLIAHELGHAMSGHAVYQTLLHRMIQLSGVARAQCPAAPSGCARDHGRAVRVVSASPSSPPTGPGCWPPRTRPRLPRAHEAGQRLRRPVRPRPDVVLRPGPGVPRPGDLRDSVLKLLLVEEHDPPVRRRPRGRAAPLGRLGRVHPDPRRRHTRAATRTHREGLRGGQEAADSYTETFQQTQDALGKLVHDLAGFFGSAKLWLDEQLRRTATELTRTRTSPGRRGRRHATLRCRGQ